MTMDIEIPNKELGVEDKNGIKKNYIVKTMELTLMGPGHIFGEEEMMEKQKRKTSVICNSQSAVMYVLAKKEFYRRIFLEDYSKSFLKENIKIKKMFREERIKDFIETEKLFLVPKGQDLLSLENNKEEKNEENKENSRSEKDVSITDGKTSTKIFANCSVSVTFISLLGYFVDKMRIKVKFETLLTQ